MISWFREYNLVQCPVCSLKASCTSPTCEVVYLRGCYRDLQVYKRRELASASPTYLPLDLSLKSALINDDVVKA